MGRDQALTERLLSLWDHLGVGAAHVATQLPDEIAGLARRHGERIAGLALCEAIGVDAEAFRGLAPRLTLVAGDGGMSGKVADKVAPLLPGCRRVTLAGYGAPIWADCVSDHTEAIVEAVASLGGAASVPAAPVASGEHAGIAYEVHGAGPALMLFPLFLSAAQWQAALPALARRFTVVVLGGRHLGGVALLEDRARSPSYAGMVRTMLDTMAPAAGERLLEVGCGSGALTRLAARTLGHVAGVTAVDINGYLLREAAALARQDGLAARIEFRAGNAEALPLADASVDHAYSVTVLEECDADLALKELRRVVKPGGRVGVIVRATDLAHPWNLDVPEALYQKIAAPQPLVGPRGVADRSLYRRMAAAGFEALVGMPMLASFNGVGGPLWTYFEGRVVARLEGDEIAAFRAAVERGRADGTLFLTSPHHCVVGTKPPA